MRHGRQSSPKKFALGIGLVVLVVLVAVALSQYFQPYATADKAVKAPNTPGELTSARLSSARLSSAQLSSTQIKEPEEPAEANSEISGKYYGLCEKQSIHSVEDFRNTVINDAALSAHFAGFNWKAAKLVKLDKETWTYVSYRNVQLDASASVPGTFVYSPASGSIPSVGTQLLSLVFTPADTLSY